MYVDRQMYNRQVPITCPTPSLLTYLFLLRTDLSSYQRAAVLVAFDEKRHW